ncbi:hypothetical protein [uncultured Dokdonia sp.]|uniref:hypothetical protein n=1 Tax=uncultured Dokdonia sp. TaxID=575653 RepID=UPI00262148A4|nr:hypothetical protein [uncultured Dokdonia sp.]
MKKVISIFPIVLLLLFASCKKDTSNTVEKETNLTAALDSMDQDHARSIRTSGDFVSKAYIIDSMLYLDANMRKDHRIFGYAQPDTLSERLFLLSIYTNDIEKNPFDLPLGAYYELDRYHPLRIQYKGHDEEFIEAIATDSLGKRTTLYFERKWVQLEDEVYTEDEVLQEYGQIENIEDGAYPFFIVTVNFIGSRAKIDLDLNIESMSLDVEGLNKLEGKYATIYYTSELRNNLQDLHYNGTSVFGEYAADYNKSWDQITGTLKGAGTVTAGDLPSFISIAGNEGENLDFEVFIDDEMVKANGKTVTVFYVTDVVNIITDILPSEE